MWSQPLPAGGASGLHWHLEEQSGPEDRAGRQRLLCLAGAEPPYWHSHLHTSARAGLSAPWLPALPLLPGSDQALKHPPPRSLPWYISCPRLEAACPPMPTAPHPSISSLAFPQTFTESLLWAGTALDVEDRATSRPSPYLRGVNKQTCPVPKVARPQPPPLRETLNFTHLREAPHFQVEADDENVPGDPDGRPHSILGRGDSGAGKVSSALCGEGPNPLLPGALRRLERGLCGGSAPRLRPGHSIRRVTSLSPLGQVSARELPAPCQEGDQAPAPVAEMPGRWAHGHSQPQGTLYLLTVPARDACGSSKVGK